MCVCVWGGGSRRETSTSLRYGPGVREQVTIDSYDRVRLCHVLIKNRISDLTQPERIPVTTIDP